MSEDFNDDNQVIIVAAEPVVGGPLEVSKGVFLSSLKRNNKQIRDDRAQAIGEDCYLAYRRAIEDFQVNIKRMERDRDNMLDLSPDNALNLRLASDFNALEFVAKDVELAVKIRNERIKLKLALARFNLLFIED
jgi:hypothetical protein